MTKTKEKNRLEALAGGGLKSCFLAHKIICAI